MPGAKPLALMRQLVRLFTQPGQVVCDPFMGSGTTGAAALLEGRGFVGCERIAAHLALAQEQIAQAQRSPPLPLPQPSMQVRMALP